VEDPLDGPARDDVEIDENKALLSGPALEGEGIDQDEVDALMSGNVAKVQPKAVATAKTHKKAASKSKPAIAPAPNTLDGNNGGSDAAVDNKDNRTTQADIDALFG